jgi:uncharacterized glyoxalase superfamily protein PhnB
MSVLGLTPMLETPDLPATKTFYTEVLGFTCDTFSEEWGWMHLRLGGAELMFARPNAHRGVPAPVFSGSLYFRTDKVDALWAALRDRCKVCYPLEAFEYGMREFAVYDNNGYLLQFGQEEA